MVIPPKQPTDLKLQCPVCPDGHGHPIKVTAGKKLVVIGMQCLACGHEWSIQRVSAA
jgi:hypothetical protein